tara:strand:+ start:1399 stop:1620 length:222 start_codon:yes stop_codon:yes gene_type:complete
MTTFNKRQLKDFARLYGDYCEDNIYYDLAENQDVIDNSAKHLRASYDALITAQDVFGIRLISKGQTFDKKEIR